MDTIRKSMLAVAAVSAIWGAAAASPVTFKLNSSYFLPRDKNFIDIYNGGIAYRLELSTLVLEHLEMWIEGGYFQKKGRLTYSKEETRLSIIPAGGGLRFVSSLGKWNLSAGLAVDYYLFRESNVLGTVHSGEFGLVGTVGSGYALGRHLLVSLDLRYSDCKMKPEELRFNLGGIEAGIGMAYRF